MPKGIPNKKPTEGGAVTVLPPVPPVRDQVKTMTGFATEEEMVASLSENTLTAPPPGQEEAPKRKYNKKTAVPATPVTDPLMADKKYVEALSDMQGFGGAGLIKGGFSTAAMATKDESWKLKTEEEKRLDGYFYVMSKKYTVLDPTGHWFLMALYFFGMLGSFIFARVAANQGEEFAASLVRWMTGKKPEQLEGGKA